MRGKLTKAEILEFYRRLAELDRLYELGYRGHVDFVDDNLIGNKKAVKAFLPDRTGRVSQVDDEGDLATTADDRCTRTTYASEPSGTSA